MTDIIAFPSARRRIFVCACDCSTFHLCEDGTAECASCGEIAEAENGAWFDATGSAPDRSPDEVAPFSDVQGNGSIDFARARVSGMASDDDAKLVVFPSINCFFCSKSEGSPGGDNLLLPAIFVKIEA